MSNLSDITATPIQIYYSNTAGNAPAGANLIAGELAVNLQDKRLWVGSGVTGGAPIALLYGPALSDVVLNVPSFLSKIESTTNGTKTITLTYDSTNPLPTSVGGTGTNVAPIANGVQIGNTAGTGFTSVSPASTDSTYFLSSGGPSAAPSWIKLTGSGGMTVQSAQNLSGGAAGGMPYQSAAGTTSYVTPGTAGQVLLSGGTGAPTFANQNTLNVGQATNLNGGGQYRIPYQSATDVTTFLPAPPVNAFLSSDLTTGALGWNIATLQVANGGTGRVSFTNLNSLLLTGSTGTGALQSLSGLAGGGSGGVLISQGADTPPTYSKTPTLNSVSLTSGGGYTWKMTETGGSLIISLNGTNVFTLDTSGNAVFRGNVTAFGSP